VELVDRSFVGVAAGGVRTEPAGVHVGHVDLGLAVDHPLGQVLAGPGTLGDADRGARAVPVVGQPRRRSHQVAGVGSVGDRSRHDLLDARAGEAGEPLGGEIQPRKQPVQLHRGEMEGQVPVDPPDPVLLGVGPLVGPDDEAVVLLAVVAGSPWIPYHRVLRRQRGHLFDPFGHQVLVDHRLDGHVEAHHRAELRGVGTGRVDHMLGHDPALLGYYLPPSVG